MTVTNIEDELNRTGRIIFSGLTGKSMLPLLVENHTAAIIEKRPDESKLSIGDVALYKKDNRYILHRVVGYEDDDYVMCGDNNIRLEHHIKGKQVLGVMSAYIVDGKETKVDDPEYLKYVGHVLKGRKARAVKSSIRQCAGKIKRSLMCGLIIAAVAVMLSACSNNMSGGNNYNQNSNPDRSNVQSDTDLRINEDGLTETPDV